MPNGAADGFDRLYTTARALGEETRFRIYRRIWRSTIPLGVSEIAEGLALHPNAIRQHLAHLEQAGLIGSRLERPGGAGRPRRLYVRSPEPLVLSHPPGSVHSLLAMLSAALDSLPSDRERLVEFGRSWGRTWVARRKRGNGPAPRDAGSRLQLLDRELFEWGWNPTSDQVNGHLTISTGRCLFHDRPPGEHGRGCALEEGLLRGLTEALLNGKGQAVLVRGCRLEVQM